MGLFGASKKEKELQAEIDRLKGMLSPEQQELNSLRLQISELETMKSKSEDELIKAQKQLTQYVDEVEKPQKKVNKLKEQLVNFEDDISVQDYGLYRPTFKFANSDLYKDRLKKCRDEQKQMIKAGKACSGNMNWTVNGSKSQGNKMVKDMQKLLLRAFNVECDDIVDNVKISNFEKSMGRIMSTSEQISKLGTIMSISISPGYVKLKRDEFCLALDFEQKKEEEKERIKEERERQREEAKAQKEIEEARKRLQKEQTHYQNALEKLNEQISKSGESEELLEKRAQLEAQIADTDKAIKDVDYREANKSAGYVYIISNIGAFGEGVYKIGMTRRLDPMDRVNELGDASVPFNFDVHALIFTDDAPALETALHSAFKHQKVNKINPRREFFRVSLDEIKTVVRQNFDKTVEWIDVAEAEQYRQSLLIK